MANHIAGVAKLLGVEVGEVFQIDKDPTLNGCVFRFSNNDLQLSAANGDNDTWAVANDSRLLGLLYGHLSIRKLPWKPAFGTEYYVPSITLAKKYDIRKWYSIEANERHYNLGIVCKTRYEAIKLANKMLAVAQEVNDDD